MTTANHRSTPTGVFGGRIGDSRYRLAVELGRSESVIADWTKNARA
ncbi:hypothetical protein ACT3S7_15135 [Corynebacterium sp. AOP34-AQ2-28]